MLTFAVVDFVQLKDVRFTEFQSAQLDAGILQGHHGLFPVFGECKVPIMHDALKVVHSSRVVYFRRWIFIEVFLLT